MKVALLTMQRGINYGSFLQAYALKKIIEEFGVEVEFVDIKQGVPLLPKYKLWLPRLIRNFKRVFKYHYHLFDIYHWNKSRTAAIAGAGSRYLGFKKGQYNYSNDYDIVFIGSDEVFNCTDIENGFRPQLLGEGFSCSKLISYAASCGYTNLQRIHAFGLEERVRFLLNRFDFLSVRDDNTYNVVSHFVSNKTIIRSLDPVLIYSFSNLYCEVPPLTDYIVVFSYFDRIANKKNEIDAIKKFAHLRKKKIVSIYGYFTWADYNLTPDPFELLRYFRYADYVFTDTFHGTLFSIKMNRPFVTFVRKANHDKLYYVLERFSLTSRSITDLSTIENVMDTDIDYVAINKIIEEEIELSKQYLKSSLYA